MCGRFTALRRAAKKCGLRQLAAGVAALVMFGGLCAHADGTGKGTTGTGTGNKDDTSWQGLNWGIGIATDFDVGGTRVNSAQIVGTMPGIVRVDNTSSNANVGFVLEMHYFLRDFTWSRAKGDPSQGACMLICTLDVATGPFVAIEVGNGSSASPTANNPITGYALGWMIGLHNTDKNAPVKTTSWNFGVGLRIDPSAQILGDGFVPNQPPPNGETAIRYKTEPRAGIMLLSSFSF